MSLTRRSLLLLGGASLAAFAGLALAFAATSGPHVGEPVEAPTWARAVGHLAGPVVLPLLTLAACAALVLVGRLAAARFLLLAVTGAGALTYALKALLQALGADQDGGRISDFPSGHSAAITALAGALLVLAWPLARDTPPRLAAAVAALGVTVAVSWSRVAVGAHSVLDVAGGAALALAWLALCVVLWEPGRAGARSATRSALLVTLVGCIGLVALLAAAYGAVRREDVLLLQRIDAHAGSAVQDAGRVLEALGGRVVLPLVVVAVLALLLVRSCRGDALFLVVAAAGADLLVHGLRLAYEPERLLRFPESSRFPSGQATTAVAIYGALALLAASALRDRRAQVFAVAGGLALGGAVGASRLVLGTKAPSDVLAGFLLGGAWLSACVLVLRERPWTR